jgi:tetratricopeptide (TPR) repeat protein
MENRVIWKVVLSFACAAGLLLGQQAAQQATEAQPQQEAAQQAPPAQPASPVAPQPSVKSQEEGQAVMVMMQAQDPDSRIKAAEELLQNFADTEFKSIALYFAAISYQEKNDFDNMIIYAERTLEVEPNHYQAMLMLGNAIAQRTREHDLDREEKLGTAEKYANRAQELLKTAVRPNIAITDEQWEAAKKDMTAQAVQALGMAAIARKNYDDAIAKFKMALETASNPDPATSLRLAIAYNRSGKPDQAIKLLDQMLADPNVHPQIKQFAQAEKVQAQQAKSGAKPAAPSAPAQVEIKQP